MAARCWRRRFVLFAASTTLSARRRRARGSTPAPLLPIRHGAHGRAGAPARAATATAAGPQEVLDPGTGTFATHGRAASADRTRQPELAAAHGRSRVQTPSTAPRRQRDPMPSPPTAE